MPKLNLTLKVKYSEAIRGQ